MVELSQQIERYRGYLRLLAEAQTANQFRARIDLSGVVQQSLWEGSRTIESSGLKATEELPRLLRQILANNLRDEIRRATAQRRDVRLERSIETSSVRLGGLLVGDDPSPSQNAILGEQVVLVAEAILQLSEDQRQVIVRHYLAGDSVDATAVAMSRSVASVAGLLHRALKQLRIILERSEIEEA
ncbi:MAG: sigma factor-like helix-turn-helix DNA-binding protein [Planctomycetaceae bacterium]